MWFHALLNFRCSTSACRGPRRRPPRARLQLEPLEARNLLSFTNVLVNDPTADLTFRDTQSETAVVLGSGGNVVVAFNDTGSILNPDLTGVGWAASTDGGDSFTDKGSPPLIPPQVGGFDPVLARSDTTGTIFLANLGGQGTLGPPPTQRGINVHRSVDNGATFSKPVNGAPGLDVNVDVPDKDWMAVDNFPGPGQGTVYLVWRNYSVSSLVSQPNRDRDAIVLTRSTDDGLTWGPDGGTIIDPSGTRGATANQLAFVTVGPDHAVYVFWWQFRKKFGHDPELVMRKSTDQGITFGDTVTVADLRVTSFLGDLGLTDSDGNEFGSDCTFQAAANPVTGDLYVVFHDQANGSADRGDVFFVQSTDGGNHWSKPLRLNDDATANDQWTPALTVTPDGSHLGVFWYDRRLDPANNLIDRFGAIGTVSGHIVTFGPNFRVTDVPFPPAIGQIRSDYMGDYDMAVADNGFFYTTWGDNRLGDAFRAHQPDVRLAKIPVTFGSAAASALLASPSRSSAAAGAGSAPVFSPAAPAGAPAAGAARGTAAPSAFAALATVTPPPVPGWPRLPAGPRTVARQPSLQSSPREAARAVAVVDDRRGSATAGAGLLFAPKHEHLALGALDGCWPDLFGLRPRDL
jgi:hypothetical protein